MTYKTWERKFCWALRGLPREEREQAIAYYREMYGEKRANGKTEESILREFGDPKICAKDIVDEEKASLKGKEKGKDIGVKKQERNAGGGSSIAEYISLFFVSLILVLPLTCAALGVIVAFGAVSISGLAAVLGGAAFICICPFAGLTWVGVLASIGGGIAAVGLGFLLFVGFFYATKYSAIGVWKALKNLYIRR
ncbi:MAG: DUF1700 domain-containing protein [Clostridia bacterium]|nr:DUF1700 domain-containing protein [Clostridia bacterium]